MRDLAVALPRCCRAVADNVKGIIPEVTQEENEESRSRSYGVEGVVTPSCPYPNREWM
jgi:hypothetical protein